jgi:hypothetical protein
MISLPALPRLLAAALTLLAVSAPLAAQKPAAAPVPLGLGAPAPAVRTEADLARFLDDLELQQWTLDRAWTLESYAQWKGEAHHQVAGIQRLYTGLASRRDYARVIDQWKPKVRDSTLARRLELQGKFFLPAKSDPAIALALGDLQSAIQDTVRLFRFQVGGRALTQTQLGAIVDSAGDRDVRRRAFEAVPQVAARSARRWR